MDIAALVPILVALLAGGAVTFYTARPHKNTLIAEAADKAVDVVTKAIDRQAEELRNARDRIAALETQLRASIEAVDALRREVKRLGGDVEQINGKLGVDDDR